MRRIALSLGIVAGGLVLASPALAAWGEDWGTMVWGAAPVGVPTLGLLGLGLLSLALAAGAVFSLRRRAWTMSVLLVALAIPLAAVASPITGLNVFSNGTTADADDVNANFDAVETAVNDNDSRVGALEASALPATSDASGVNLGNHLDVSGNLTSTGSEGGIITANRGVGTIVIDPTAVSSGYTATLSLDDQGIKLGHNSGARDIQFQIQNTTKMTLSRYGNLNVDGDVTSTNLSSHFGNANAHHVRYSDAEALAAADGVNAGTLDGLDSTDLAAVSHVHANTGYARVAIVAQSGGDYTNPAFAMNDLPTWCDLPSASNPCLLRIMPGVYDLGSNPLMMQAYVDIEGSGEKTTTVTSTHSSTSYDENSATLIAADNAEIRFLTVENQGGDLHSIAMWNAAVSPKITNVSVAASGYSMNYGIVNSSSSPTMTNVTITASGGSNVNYGIVNSSSSSPTMTNVTSTGFGDGDNRGVSNEDSSPTMMNGSAIAYGGSSNYGVRNHNSSPTMTNVSITATGVYPGLTMGVHNNTSSEPTMTGVTVTASGGYPSYGVYIESGDNAIIINSTIYGDMASLKIFQGGGTARVVGTRLATAVSGPDPNQPIYSGFTCLGAYDASFIALDANCK